MQNIDLKKEFDRLHRKLNLIIENQNAVADASAKKTWVKVGVIQKLTGWGKRDLEVARKNGLVKVVRRKGQIEYLLESLNPMYIKEEFRAKG